MLFDSEIAAVTQEMVDLSRQYHKDRGVLQERRQRLVDAQFRTLMRLSADPYVVCVTAHPHTVSETGTPTHHLYRGRVPRMLVGSTKTELYGGREHLGTIHGATEYRVSGDNAAELIATINRMIDMGEQVKYCPKDAISVSYVYDGYSFS